MYVNCSSCKRRVQVNLNAVIATRLVALGHTPEYAWRVAERTPSPKALAGVVVRCPCCMEGCDDDPCAARTADAVNDALACESGEGV